VDEDIINVLLPRIIEAAVGAGIRIEHVSLSHPDMNDVFIHYTGKDLRQEEVRRKRFGRMAMMRLRRAR
jgi:ABC-2 type transport system ATP-binding protein